MFSSPEESLKLLLASLRAAHWVHWSGHWQVRSGIVEEIDTLAEKTVALYNVSAVDPLEQIDLSQTVVADFCEGDTDPTKRSLQVEEYLQSLFQDVFDYLESQARLPLGLNDYISSTANNHETYLYLLRQRSR
jgi:hypothetical protein